MFKINVKKREIPKLDILKNVYLECKEGTSNKFYRVQVVKNATNNDEAITTAHYGPIGKKGVSTVKYRGNRSYAFMEAGSLVGEKLKKGYIIVKDPIYEEK